MHIIPYSLKSIHSNSFALALQRAGPKRNGLTITSYACGAAASATVLTYHLSNYNIEVARCKASYIPVIHPSLANFAKPQSERLLLLLLWERSKIHLGIEN